MVYLLVELFNYRQLTRLRGDILPGLQQRLGELYAGGKHKVARLHDGTALIDCGKEEDFDAAGCSTLALRVLETLRGQRADIFGFSMVIAILPGDEPERIVERMRELVSSVEGQENFWLTAPAASVLSPYIAVEGSGELRRFAAARRPEPPKKTEAKGMGWTREALVQRLLDALSPRLSGEPEVVLLYGPAGSGKTALVMEAAKRLGAGDQKAPVLRARTIFRRRSVVHPFINSLDSSLMAEVPHYLRGPEHVVWEETVPLLLSLSGMDSAKEPFPDHLREDFLLGYQLYLSALIRMTSSRLLPAFLVFEGIETYHPEARALAARLIGEHLPHNAIIPVLTSTVPDIPEEFSSFTIKPFRVHPLGRREIRSMARYFYPGLEIPPEVVRELKRRTGGLFGPLMGFLRVSAAIDRIHASDGLFQWKQAPSDLDDLPADSFSVSSVLARALPRDSMLVLYALCVCGGLFERGSIVSFLSRAGFEAQAAESSIAGLISEGLLEEDDLLPNVPAVGRALEDMLRKDADTLRETLISRLYALWKSGAYSRTVLLFSLLARSGKTDLALDVLPHIIRRKIDEGDFSGARLFCDPSRLEFSVPPGGKQRENLALIAEAGLLRISVREEAWVEAERRYQALARHQRAVPEGEAAGDAALARSLYCLARGDSHAALEELKSSLITFQETGFARGERSAYHLLGLTMLGEGRTGEGIEYLGLAERMAVEARDALGAVRSASYLAVCYFLEGRYTQCLQVVERAEAAARAGYQRDLEMFLRFVKVRSLFQLGLYQDCSQNALDLLCLSTIYAGRDANRVASAWLARSVLYSGNPDLSSRMLEKLDQTREVMFFSAEAAYFTGSLEKASSSAERALALPVSGAFPPPEAVTWRDGFSCIEGRCFRFGRDETLLMRGIRAMAGCLMGLRGLTREGIRDLHKLIRGEDSPGNDPNFSLHAYFYSLVLPEFASEEGDDKTTILSKSLKALQERASRIESPAQKSAFLGLNYWNRKIMDDARQRKLI